MTHLKRVSTALALLTSLLALVFPTSPSFAGEGTCVYDSVDERVLVTALDLGTFQLRRRNAEIVFKKSGTPGYESCGDATVNNTDLIEFVDESDSGQAWFIINQSRGSFAPGSSPESEGASEVEFNVETGSPYGGGLEVYGTSRPDLIIGGKRGLKLNGDKDLDVRVSGPEKGYGVWAGEGDDSVFLDGRGRTGSYGEEDGHTHYLRGGPGSDSLVGASDKDRFFGGNGNDSLFGSGSRDDFYSGAGIDHVFGGAGNDFVDAQGGFDFVEGGSGDDSIEGNDGEDRLKGGPGQDRIFGHQGSYGSRQPEDDDADRIWGQKGNDSVRGDGGDDRIIAGAGNDLIKGRGGADNLEGSSGDDEIFGHQGNDHLDGDAGSDGCGPGPGLDTKEDCERNAEDPFDS
jgi:Ca2+-binding RTX toxin-like protein